MNPERWRQCEKLYHGALSVPPDARTRYLRSECADDELRKEVESLLSLEDAAQGFLEDPQSGAPPAPLIGRKIGVYEVLSAIGAGGMGEVYRARDTILLRDVALKVLPPAFANDPDRLQRFRREARTLAALNHPNIETIHGLEEFEEGTCLVMELVEGETLSGPLPLNRVLDYARQVADAIAAAHDRGVIHRDLKPANVKVTPDATVKVLDFGLAKAVATLDDKAEVVPNRPYGGADSLSGLILGTPPYMSPEQVRSEPVDQRTDIWSFGCLLYELLTGQRAFRGESLPDTLFAIVQRQPDWSALPPRTPASVRKLIQSCLEKDVSRRLQTIAEARIILQRAQQKGPRWPLATAAGFGAIILIASAFIAWRGSRVPRPTALHVTPLTTYRGAELFPAVSPDGRSIAFTWTGINDRQLDLYTRPLEGEPPVKLTDDPDLECYPAWSPDGKLIAFLHCSGNMGGIRAEAEVYVVPASGGPKRRVGKISVQAYDNVVALAWMPNGRELVVRNRARETDQIGVASLNIDTGAMRQITTPPASYDDASPAPSLDGRRLAFVRQTTAMRGDIFLQDLKAPSSSARQITHEQHRIYGVGWRSANELIYLAEQGTARTLWKLDVDTLEREPLSGAGQVGVQFCLFRDGRRLIYSDAYIDTDIRRVDLSHASAGKPLSAETLIASTQWDGAPDYSSDGRKIVFASARSGDVEIWIANADGSNPTQVTYLRRYTGSPRWSPNGKEIAADSQEGDSTDIYVIDAANRNARKITSGRGHNFVPSWSRDGKWVYFVSDRHDGYQVWKALAHQPRGNEHALQITRNGGTSGYESVDGKRFYYAKTPGSTCVWTVPADGGEETEIVCPLSSWAYTSVFEDGLYYAPQTSRQIWFFNFADRRSRHVFDLKDGAGGAFGFSPDRRWLLITAADLHRGDLHLVNLGE